VLGMGAERVAPASGAQTTHPSRPTSTTVPKARMRTRRPTIDLGDDIDSPVA
jgi:hypothetical protein